jgi:hypothetical protein
MPTIAIAFSGAYNADGFCRVPIEFSFSKQNNGAIIALPQAIGVMLIGPRYGVYSLSLNKRYLFFSPSEIGFRKRKRCCRANLRYGAERGFFLSEYRLSASNVVQKRLGFYRPKTRNVRQRDEVEKFVIHMQSNPDS